MWFSILNKFVSNAKNIPVTICSVAMPHENQLLSNRTDDRDF